MIDTVQSLPEPGGHGGIRSQMVASNAKGPRRGE